MGEVKEEVVEKVEVVEKEEVVKKDEVTEKGNGIAEKVKELCESVNGGDEVKDEVKDEVVKGEDEVVEEEAGFANMNIPFEFDETCMIITIIFVILFMYKEEIMKTNLIRKLLK